LLEFNSHCQFKRPLTREGPVLRRRVREQKAGLLGPPPASSTKTPLLACPAHHMKLHHSPVRLRNRFRSSGSSSFRSAFQTSLDIYCIAMRLRSSNSMGSTLVLSVFAPPSKTQHALRIGTCSMRVDFIWLTNFVF